MKKILFFASCLLLLALGSKAQIHRFNPDTIISLKIDSPVNIRSHRLNAQDFIDAIVTDTSFYRAFRHMKLYNFVADNRIYTYDKNNRVNGKIYRRVKHDVVNGKHHTEYLAKTDSGAVYKKNGKYELYTVEMFDFIFDNAYNTDFEKNDQSAMGGKNGSYKTKMKTLIFEPGRKITGLPFISGKTEIFGKEMRQYYSYQFAKGKYLDTIPVYRFKVTKKPSTSDDDVMIREMTTIFDARDMKILGRYVDMKYHNMLFSFDIQMNIEMNRYYGELLPVKVSYQGNWDIPFHQTERASFLITQHNYKK